MNDVPKKWALLAVRVVLILPFAAAGLAKLAGGQILADEFALIGVGQWLRYVTGIIEVGSAVLLWVPGYTASAAGLMVGIVVGALLAHLVILGMATSQPAMLLGGAGADHAVCKPGTAAALRFGKPGGWPLRRAGLDSVWARAYPRR